MRTRQAEVIGSFLIVLLAAFAAPNWWVAALSAAVAVALLNLVLGRLRQR